MVPRSIRHAKVIAGGTVFDPAAGLDCVRNIFIEAGKISEISDDRQALAAASDVSDATGLHIFPAFIDLHVHLREPGFEYKEDIESGSRAALAGGFGTILCMPNTNPVNDCAKITRYIIDRAKSVGLVNVSPIGAMTVGLEGEKLADYEGMLREGIVAISDDGRCIQDYNLAFDAFASAKELDLLVISHPEFFAKSAGGHINAGSVAKKLGLRGINRSAENDAIQRDLEIAERTGARLHLTHVSTMEGMELVRKAKSLGLCVTCEVTPHHLLLTEDDVERLSGNAKMNPPLRTKADRHALIAGINDGTVDAIATDHAPHAAAEKQGIEKSAFGVIGMENAFSVCMRLVDEGLVTLERLVELFTSGPAKVLRRDMAILKRGFPASLCIVDLKKEFQLSGKFESKSSNCPFIGCRVRGEIFAVII